MGYLTEYLNRNMTFEQVTAERKDQLRTIARARGGRDVLVYAADLNKTQVPTQLDYSDLLPVSDQLADLRGQAIDVILETPGGLAEVADEVVRRVRERYADVAYIVPGWAKSAGTIMVMSGDDILMGRPSAVGPIGAQLFWQGRLFSAEAFLQGFDKIAKEAATGLNRAYIPILQALSPGDLQAAQNALDFAQTLVTDWLTRYKFRTWVVHARSGAPVTHRQRRLRARRIARTLCSHRKWLSHGRSLKIHDLREMGLQVTDFDQTPALAEAIGRYYALLQITFQTTVGRNIYKVIETAVGEIYRQAIPGGPTPPGVAPSGSGPTAANVDVRCPKCGGSERLQANLGSPAPLLEGARPFPEDGQYRCPQCGTRQDLTPVKRQIEAQTGQQIAPS